MKKFLISTLLSFTLSFPSFAEDIVLTFSPETCADADVYLPNVTTSAWGCNLGDYEWNFQNFWAGSNERSTIVCGPKDAYIQMITPIEQAVSEVIITIDNIDRSDISSITLDCIPSDAYYPVFSILIEDIYDNPEIQAGTLSFKIDTPQENLTYTLKIKIFSHSYTTNVLQISKIVYKAVVEQQTPTLSWSDESATAILGDDTFVAPTLSCDPDDDAIKSLINYSSSDSEVASIDADGKLTLLSPGTTTITASIPETDAVAAASASYELTVEADPNTILLSFASANMNAVDTYNEIIKATSNETLWTIKNFCNGDGEWSYIRCGGNYSENTASITTDFPISDHLTEIVVTIDDFKADKIENITLYAYGEANLDHPVESISMPPAIGDVVFDVTAQPGLKYSVVVNCLGSDPDGSLQISKISYHKATDVVEAENAKLRISESDHEDAVFTECNASTYESNDCWVVLKFDVPQEHTVWHRFVNGSEIIIPQPIAQTFISRAATDADRHGFQQFVDTPFKHIDNGALEYYTENAEGTRSQVQRVDFTGVTSIDEIGVDSNETVEYYNLQGIRIDYPTPAGIYIARRAGKTIKIIK